MLATTIATIKTGLRDDLSLSPSDRARILAAIRNGGISPKPESTTGRVARIVRRAEAASRLSCSLRTIDKLAATGVLTKKRLPGHQRAVGFLEADLNALLGG